MSIEQSFGNLFKSEVKAAGRKLVAQEKVSVTSTTDTTIQAYVRIAPLLKVSLTSEGISSPVLTAECSCPAARKGQLCKHVWATLLCVEEKSPDFLNAKQVIEKPGNSSDRPPAPKNVYQEAAKARAAEYRKEQYQKQKLQAKKLKREASMPPPNHPPEVETALAYFSVNGFALSEDLSEDTLGEAKRKLSRVFHPDKGGSHDESVELNRNWELLLRYLRSF